MTYFSNFSGVFVAIVLFECSIFGKSINIYGLSTKYTHYTHYTKLIPIRGQHLVFSVKYTAKLTLNSL